MTLYSVRLRYRVQLNLHVCAPFGAYEIDLDVESYSDESVQNVEYPPSTSWTIWNGVDEVLTESPNILKRGAHDKNGTFRLFHSSGM